MESAAQAISHAHELYTRSGAAVPGERPPAFKAIGIGLAVGSGAFIGTSFVLKKVGLLRANEKYNEVAGEGYGYLKNFYWWAGMTLMILGEGLNFAAYAFTDAILVTPLGALSVVITTILSAIFLKERLSMVGKVACFLCIVGSVVIVMNAPENSSVATIQEMQGFVIHPAFLTYAGVIIVGSVIVAFWLGPKYGNKNMLVYISICSWIGGLSVVATQGLGAAIIAQAGGTPQFNQWFLYVLLVFVIATLLTEIIYLNKALNLFNAALVTPTYYVYFTSTTIITSAVLFRGFKGTPTSIITVVNGFLTICSGVVLLQLSKSAKDVPDAAVFTGDLDQIHTIAEQPQPETEPKADAIRGAAAIVRRLSSARQKMELEELKRLHEEKMQETLESVDENGVPKYEWDGIRRRRTGTFSSARTGTFSTHRSIKSPAPPSLAPPTPHPPLGWSHFPTEEELAEANRPLSPALSSIVGTIRTKARSVLPGHPDFRKGADAPKVQSPMHPVQLTSISVAGPKPGEPEEYRSAVTGEEGSGSTQHVQFADSAGLAPPTPPLHSARRQFSFQNMFKRGQSPGRRNDGPSDHRRQRISSRGYSSPQMRGATEEETLGLVKGDSHTSMPALRGSGKQYDDSDDDDGDYYYHVEEHEYRDDKEPAAAARLYGHSITKGYNTSPSRKAGGESDEKGLEQEIPDHEKYRRRLRDKRRSESANRNEQEEDRDRDKDKPLPRLPPLPFGGGGNGGGFM
ncbi:magnesium transporter NIPA-domain-containing protein [Chaetomium strumarium]|uniref:Magnesium transporter NIPA-domain-containing protein n=1 Tax=Chaetomium strumarium TaxID=1170767 RepID=A0AAJ0GWH2_9PEZI|nr:magnesium transporter NIPA-domain-containing protein [Chaetomium strumarium]